MTAKIINLNRARKAKARADKANEAEQNRARFGRTKAERTANEAETERNAKFLDGSKLEPANEGHFPSTAAPDDDDLDPGTVS